jgi:hypothetical protein
MFMCKRHWYMLPGVVRNQIWATYRPGQCDDRRPSQRYCDAAKNALTVLAQKEGRTITGNEPELLLYDFAAAGLLAPSATQEPAK